MTGRDSPVSLQGTVYDAFKSTAERDGARPFLNIVTDTARRYGIDPQTFSYGQAYSEVLELRQKYAAAGLGVGHRAALLLENRPEFFFHWLALNGLGVSAVPLNPAWRAAELEYVLGHSEACLAVTLPERLADVTAAAQKVDQMAAVTVYDALLPETHDFGDTIAVPRTRQQLEKRIGIIGVIGSQTLGHHRG